MDEEPWLNDPTHALDCGVAESLHYPHMLSHCEADNLLAVSSLINVGHLVDSANEVMAMRIVRPNLSSGSTDLECSSALTVA